MKKVTIKDVAKHAGVSASTVSRVVSKKGKISTETTNRIYEAIELLGYVPNYNARSLVNNNTDTIAVVVDRSPKSLDNAYFSDVLKSIAMEISTYEKEILLIFSEKNFEERDKIKNLVETNRIDGVIKLSVMKDDLTVDYLSDNQIPAVVIGNPENKGKVLWVDNDNEHAMYEVVTSLIEDGKKNLCFVGGSSKFIVTRDRLNGFKKALKKNGIDFLETQVYHVDFSEEDAYRNADRIINANYDAIVCTDDLIALGILRRANDKNKKIYVIGFNNSREANWSSTSIPTVDIMTDKLGKWAVRLLMGRINGDITVTNKIVMTKFIKK